MVDPTCPAPTTTIFTPRGSLPLCGRAAKPTATGTLGGMRGVALALRAARRRDRSRRRRSPRGRPRRGSWSSARGLSSPVLVTQAPGEPARLYVVEQPGRIRVVERGRVQGGCVPRRPLSRRRGRRAGPAGAGVLAAVRARQDVLRQLHGEARRVHQGRPLPRRERPGRPGERAGDPSRRAALREPQRRQPRVRARRQALGRARRRRLGRRPGEPRPESPTACSGKMLRLDVAQAQPTPELVGDRPPEPVALQLRPRRPATSGSATSARTRSRRSTGCRAGRPASSTSAGTCTRGVSGTATARSGRDG